MDLKAKLRKVADFPKPGITFIDITTVLQDADLLTLSLGLMKKKLADSSPFDLIVAPESRGFIFGVPLAYTLGKGFVPIRKKGKLPYETISLQYDLEYGADELEIHRDAIKPGQKVVIVDDLLATGGTTESNIKLIEKLGGQVTGILYFIELGFLNGKEKLKGYPVDSILTFHEGDLTE